MPHHLLNIYSFPTLFAFQTECNEKYPKGVKPGEVAVTAGYQLQCAYVYHGALPNWEKKLTARKVKYV